MKILACRRASWSQSAAVGSGWASIAPVMMMSTGVASVRIVPSRRPRARTCSRRFRISVLWASCFSCEGQFDLVVDYEGGAEIRLTDHYRSQPVGAMITG
jgi:hypothetical protein